MQVQPNALAALESTETPVNEGQTQWAGVLCDWLQHEQTLQHVLDYFTLEQHYTVSAVCRYLLGLLRQHPEYLRPIGRAVHYFWKAKTELQALSREEVGQLPAAQEVAINIRAPESY